MTSFPRALQARVLGVTLTFRATRPGRHGGQLDVWTPTEICTTVYATIGVGEGG